MSDVRLLALGIGTKSLDLILALRHDVVARSRFLESISVGPEAVFQNHHVLHVCVLDCSDSMICVLSKKENKNRLVAKNFESTNKIEEFIL